MNCRICKSDKLTKYLDLGKVPLANNLLPTYYAEYESYPIEVYFCEDCNLSQLGTVIEPSKMYSDYFYHSSVSQTFKNHCHDLAVSLRANFRFHNDPPASLDIACNDGALMREFKKVGFIPTGVEPCKKLADIARGWNLESPPPEDGSNLMNVMNNYWNKEGYSYARSWSGQDVITATNVLAHVDNLDEFIDGIHHHKNPSTVFVAEFPYLKNLIANNQFDTIYHEHLSYFLLKPLVRLFARNNFPIFKVEEIPIHGGSLRIYAGIHQEDGSVSKMLEEENKAGLYDIGTYYQFAIRVAKIKADLLAMLDDMVLVGRTVIAYGASAKGISLLNYCGIDNELLTAIVDETPAKQYKFTPGSRIPIIDFSHFEKKKPDYILLLAWNFQEELVAKTKHLGAEYIVPIPQVKIL